MPHRAGVQPLKLGTPAGSPAAVRNRRSGQMRATAYSRPGNDLTYRFSLIVEALARLCVPVQLTVGPQRAAARLTGGKRTARWARAMRCPAATQGSPPVRLPGALCTRTRGLARGTEGHSSGVLAAARGGYPKKASCADRLERSNIGGGGVSAHVIVS